MDTKNNFLMILEQIRNNVSSNKYEPTRSIILEELDRIKTELKKEYPEPANIGYSICNVEETISEFDYRISKNSINSDTNNFLMVRKLRELFESNFPEMID